MALAISLAVPVAGMGQSLEDGGFSDHRAAAVDQYETPTPTPSTTVAPTATQSGGGGPVIGGTGGGDPSVGGDDTSGRGSGRDGDPTEPVDLGIAPDSAAGRDGDALRLGDAQGGRLPFTGLDLLTVALIGMALLALGFLLAWINRQRGDAHRAA